MQEHGRQRLTGHPEQASRAAQYVRMSTDHQKYSTANQADAIAVYAEQRGLSIVRTYADNGRSGLDIGGREAIQRLIDDVRRGRADFDVILVYDVSRWGRFQDADESAYYEFICREAGVQVLYCAEMFENDGSLTSTILKNLKRAMAGEYSRELSVKVFMGQCRVTRMGFWRGGPPGYGLRRQLIDEHGTVKARLEDRQRKSLQTDRTVLVHGPDLEIQTVKRIFSSYVADGKRTSEIATELNADQIRTVRGRRWSAETVGQILANEKYTGSIIFNRSSYKLKQKRVVNPADMWVRYDNAFPAIISPEMFAKAQSIVRNNRSRRSNQDVLERLEALRREKGYLTRALVETSEGAYSAGSYVRRFGSLVAAYKLIGFQPAPRYRFKETADRFHSILEKVAGEVVTHIVALGGKAAIDHGTGLIINDEVRISLASARAVSEGLGHVRWKVHADKNAASDLTLMVRMDPSNTKVLIYYLLPTSELARAQARATYIRISHRIFAEACRYESLEALCRTCAALEPSGPA